LSMRADLGYSSSVARLPAPLAPGARPRLRLAPGMPITTERET
jgi:hypothetical protein